MAQKKAAPFGSWPSPLTAELVLSSAISFSDALVTPHKELLWLEGRPSEAGRNAIVHSAIDGKPTEVIPIVEGTPPLNARTRVHEYGGSSLSAGPGGKVIFSSIEGPLYEVEPENGGWTTPKQITPKSDVLRFADFSSHPTHPTLLVAVCEDHTVDEPSKVVNTIVSLDTASSELTTIVSGADFYSAPRFSASGKFLCYISWQHPEMPWQGSELYVAEVTADGTLVAGSAQKVAGAPHGVESVSQPRWSLEGDTLVFLSDRTGFYQLYSWSRDAGVSELFEKATEQDVGGPDWVFGQSTHAPLTSSSWISKGKAGSLVITSLTSSKQTSISTSYASISALRVVSPNHLLVVGTPHTTPDVLAILTISADGTSVTEKIIKRSSEAAVDSEYIAVGKSITFPTKSAKGEADGQLAHAIYYAPANKDYIGKDGEKPPLVVHCHGGPTSSAHVGLAWSNQYFTSRGFAYVDVDYGGSTGYGKAFRDRLTNNWGVVDVDDTIACVEYLVKEGLVDPKRVSITGGSAGGFTVLAALCAGDVFGAGTSLYGISDLVLLAGDTHKFESQYLFGLVGGTPEEVPKAYHDRSPINNSANITAPLLLLQGSLDRVVPPEQATKMADTIKAAGGQAELIMFEGEGHGFRRADSKKRAFEAEVAFYRKTFGIPGSEE